MEEKVVLTDTEVKKRIIYCFIYYNGQVKLEQDECILRGEYYHGFSYDSIFYDDLEKIHIGNLDKGLYIRMYSFSNSLYNFKVMAGRSLNDLLEKTRAEYDKKINELGAISRKLDCTTIDEVK